MRIAESNVQMVSERQYSQAGARGNAVFGRNDSFLGIANRMYENQYGEKNNDSEKWLNYGKDGQLKTAAVKDGVVQPSEAKPTEEQKSLLKELMERMKKYGLLPEQGIAGNIQRISTEVFIERQVSYQESEQTAFQAKGQAVTEDGRTIDFDVNLLMSRSYMEYTNVRRSAVTGMLMDPLVINVGAQVTDISDQTFTFDLDADGVEEEIPMLGEGSGFLAYDANNDGKINDGSELFGARTGDGFEELKKYDEDGNGWIDENDSIFSKLKVWCRNEKGENILMDLKAADVGAIYLGNQSTEFSLKGSDGGDKAVIRSSGFFLRESGSVGTMQQVDLAVKESEELSKLEKQPIIYKEITTVTQFIGGKGSAQENSEGNTATKEAAEERDSFTKSAKERAQERADRRQQMEARRIQKREQKKLMEERFAKRRQEHKDLLERVQERSAEHRQELAESYEWLRMRRSYNRA